MSLLPSEDDDGGDNLLRDLRTALAEATRERHALHDRVAELEAARGMVDATLSSDHARLQAHAERLRAALVEACDALAGEADIAEALTATCDEEERARIARLRSVAAAAVHPSEDVAP